MLIRENEHFSFWSKWSSYPSLATGAPHGLIGLSYEAGSLEDTRTAPKLA